MEPETKTPRSYENSIYRKPPSDNHPHVVETSDGRIKGKGKTKATPGVNNNIKSKAVQKNKARPELVKNREDGRRQERKGSDSRILQQTVNTDTIKEEPSSEDISPDLEASFGGYHEDISGLVEPRTLRRISSSGRTTEIDSKPAEPLIVERHNEIKIGSRVMVRGFMEKGTVRWLGITGILFDEIRCIAGLEMERSNSIYNDKYDDRSWFDGPVGHVHYEECDQLEVIKLETKKPRSYESAIRVGRRILGKKNKATPELVKNTKDGRRQERKGNDSRILQQTVNTDTIKEEPSSEDISPDLEYGDLYGPGTSSQTRQTPEKRENHQRPNDIDSEVKQGPELKIPPLKDLSQVKRVSQYIGLEENAMVQTTGKKTLYGVIRWMGYLPGRPAPPEPPLVGIEMEEGSYTERKTSGQQQYGVYDGYQLFECKSGRSAFFNSNRLLKDQRLAKVETAETGERSQTSGGQMANFEPFHELLECSVCLERFTYPKVLPCQHTFCLNCLRGIGKGAKTVTCPQCREVHPIPENGMANLKDNFVIKNLLGIVEEGNVCFDCGQETSLSKCKHCEESVCADCRATHAELLGEIKMLLRLTKGATADCPEKNTALWNDLLQRINVEKQRANEKFDDLHQKIEKQKGNVLQFLETMEKRVRVAVNEDEVPLAQAMQQQLGACKTTSSLKDFKHLLDSTEGMMTTALETGRPTDFKIAYNSYTMKPVGNVVFGDEVFELK